MGHILSKIIGLILLVAAMKVVMTGWQTYQAGQNSRVWPTTAGKVVSNEIDKSNGSDDDTPYNIYVRYTYQVHGQTFKNNSIRHHAMISFATMDQAEEYIKKYPVGGIVKVYYDPQNPADAMLIPGSTAEGPFLIFFGIFLSFISVLIAWPRNKDPFKEETLDIGS